jgi:hypothetical protein
MTYEQSGKLPPAGMVPEAPAEALGFDPRVELLGEISTLAQGGVGWAHEPDNSRFFDRPDPNPNPIREPDPLGDDPDPPPEKQ